MYKIINHTRKIEYVIFKEGAHFKKNQNAPATKSNCDVYKIVCPFYKSQKPHAKNPWAAFQAACAPWGWAWDARTRRPQAGPRGWSIFGPNENLIFAKTFEGKIACKLQEAITFSFWIVMA